MRTGSRQIWCADLPRVDSRGFRCFGFLATGRHSNEDGCNEPPVGRKPQAVRARLSHPPSVRLDAPITPGTVLWKATSGSSRSWDPCGGIGERTWADTSERLGHGCRRLRRVDGHRRRPRLDRAHRPPIAPMGTHMLQRAFLQRLGTPRDVGGDARFGQSALARRRRRMPAINSTPIQSMPE